MTTTAAELNTLATRLDDIADRIMREFKVELPRERTAANGDETLLGNIARRTTDLRTASTMHAEAKTAFMAAKATYKVEPTTAEKNYAAALVLAADIEAILDYRTKKADTSTPAPTTGGDGDGGDPKGGAKPAAVKVVVEEPAPVPAPTSDSDADKAEKKDEGDDKAASDPAKGKAEVKKDGETDPILAAIAKLDANCNKRHGELGERIDALAKGTLPEELATILKDLDPEVARILAGLKPEELRAALSGGRGLTDEQAAFLKALMDVEDGSPLDRFRFVFWGTARDSGAHS